MRQRWASCGVPHITIRAAQGHGKARAMLSSAERRLSLEECDLESMTENGMSRGQGDLTPKPEVEKDATVQRRMSD